MVVPGRSLVVSQAVRERLEGLPYVEFSKVVFRKLIDLPYQAGDSSYWGSPLHLSNPEFTDPEALIRELPNDPELYRGLGDYYELVVPRLSDIKDQFVDLKSVTCTPSDVLGTLGIEISESLLKAYPIFRYGCNFFSVKAYERISEFLDNTYFETHKFFV